MSDVRQMPLFPGQPQTPADLNVHTALKDTFALFQQHLMKEGKSEHTVKAFTSDLNLLAEHDGEATAIGDFTTTRLNNFLHWLEHGRGVPCSRKSYARRVTTLKVFFKWLTAVNALPHDPAKAILQRSGPAPLPFVLTPDEIMAAQKAARSMTRNERPDTRPEMLFRLLLETGIKKNEAMRIEAEHIDRKDPENPVLLVKYKTRNVFKERKVPVSAGWVELLDAYLLQYQPEDAIFNCTPRNLEYILEDIGKLADIPVKISFEMMRWTSALRDYQAGVDPDMIRERLGLSRVSWQETHGKIMRLAEMQSAQDSGANQ